MKKTRLEAILESIEKQIDNPSEDRPGFFHISRCGRKVILLQEELGKALQPTTRDQLAALVKPLEWVEVGHDRLHFPDHKTKEGYFCYKLLKADPHWSAGGNDGVFLGEHPTLEAAKSACQEHYVNEVLKHFEI